MTPHTSRMRMEFKVPSRGMFGFKSDFLTDTRGEGIFSAIPEDYEPYKNIEYCSHAGQILQEEHKAIEHILSDYKRVLEINEVLLKENEEFKKDYYNVINKIENKIDRFDYEFEKAKKQNNKDKSDYYWNLIINFTKLLESEE